MHVESLPSMLRARPETRSGVSVRRHADGFVAMIVAVLTARRTVFAHEICRVGADTPGIR